MPKLPIQPVDAPLYVVAPIINPSRYRARYSLYRDFEKYITNAGAILYTVEAAYGDRDCEVTDAANQRHIRLRTNHEVWHKENLINIGVSRLPSDWKYVAWIDADVQFARPDIIAETIQQLQHFSVVQMFAQSTDLGPRHEPLRSLDGFVAQWTRHSGSRRPSDMERYSLWHPGYAWACRRDAWDHLGGLIDFAIVGSADRYMACALIGDIARSLSADMVRDCPTYTDWCLEWQARAETYIKRNIGFVDGCCCTISTAQRRIAATRTARRSCGRTGSTQRGTSSATGKACGSSPTKRSRSGKHFALTSEAARRTARKHDGAGSSSGHGPAKATRTRVPTSLRNAHHHRRNPVHKAGKNPLRLFHQLDEREALHDLLPEDCQLQLRQAIAHATMNAEPE
jgi:hypothetical protein